MEEKVPWWQNVPRPQFAQFREIPAQGNWFRVYEIVPGVFALLEPHHFQEVMSFLIVGGEQALLLDTGEGMGDIRREVQTLTELPIVVVNSHTHFDHIGGNHQFKAAHILNVPGAAQALQAGWRPEAGNYNFQPDAFRPDVALPFDLKNFDIAPSVAVPIQEGHIFSLGGRELEVIAAPGHAADALMLADHCNKLLFTGDTFYPGPLYAHTEADRQRQLVTYRDTLHKLVERFADYTLVCSHNESICPGSFLAAAADAFDAILADTAPYEMEGALRSYSFEGFSVITKDK